MQKNRAGCLLWSLTDKPINQKNPMTGTPQLNLEQLNPAFAGKKPSILSDFSTWRVKVADGWLVMFSGPIGVGGVTFYPDPNHAWEGGTLP